MSASTEGLSGPDPASRLGSAGAHLGFERGLDICPFLRSADAAWSSASASRDLRCWAVCPATQPAVQKQRQLCVAPAHGTCATFLAAGVADPLVGDHPDADGAALWPATSPTPVALEVQTHPRVVVGPPRTGGQALLVGLMVVAFLVLVIARANPLGGGDASGSPGPSGLADASTVVGPSAASASGPTASVAVTPAPTTVVPTAPAPTTAPTASPQASPTQRTYKVRSGDTIASIAVKFHSTVKAIVNANSIVDPSLIHPGQVLIIP